MRCKVKMSAETSRTQIPPVIQVVFPQAARFTMQQNANSFEQSGWLIRCVGLWNCCLCWLFVSELSSCSCRFALRRHLWWRELTLMHRNKCAQMKDVAFTKTATERKMDLLPNNVPQLQTSCVMISCTSESWRKHNSLFHYIRHILFIYNLINLSRSKD